MVVEDPNDRNRPSGCCSDPQQELHNRYVELKLPLAQDSTAVPTFVLVENWFTELEALLEE